MEIIQSRFGVDRSIERIDFQRLLVMGESQLVRKTSYLFDFEGGPVYIVGNKIYFEKLWWRINKVKPSRMKHEKLYGCVLTVEPIYPT